MENALRCSSSGIHGHFSPVWNSTADRVFSRRSIQDENDDEEALKWAAIEKLPTYRRLKKGLFTGEGGETTEIDIFRMGSQEKKILLDRLVRFAEEDNGKFLLKLKDRIDRVGIDLPTIEVRFEHLKVDTEAHVGARALPTVFNSSINIVEKILGSFPLFPSRKRPFSILNDVSGIIKPSRLTLLLRPPSSGKSTLLLALAGKLDSGLKVSGKITYNGHEMNEFVPQRTSAYISQHDLHIGEMTVRETLDFSARCQGAGAGYEMLAELSRREKAANIKPDPNLDALMKAVTNRGNKASVVTDYILKEEQAILNYRKEHKKDFKHIEIYKEVANHSRWKQAIIASEEKNKRERAQKRPTATRRNDAAAEDDAAGDGVSPFDADGHTILTRPDGRAPEKERRKLVVQNRELIQSTSTRLNAYLGDQQSRNVKKYIELEKRIEWYRISCGNVTTIANSVSEMTGIARESHQFKKEQQIMYKIARYQHALDQPAPPNATVEQLEKLATLKNTALDKLNALMML